VICEYTDSNHFTPHVFIPFYHILINTIAASCGELNPKRLKEDLQNEKNGEKLSVYINCLFYFFPILLLCSKNLNHNQKEARE